jgi:hypothetical protein
LAGFAGLPRQRRSRQQEVFPISAKLFFLTMVFALLAGALLLVSLHTPLAVQADGKSQGAFHQQPARALPEKAGLLDAANGAPFAYVNQPWDWVEGRTTAGATVQATLFRNSSVYTTAQTVADSDGWFTIQFLQGNSPLDILAGDEVAVFGGALIASIDVITIEGTIDVVSDTVSGQMAGGIFPAAGMVGVGRSSDTLFTTHTITVAVDGTYSVDFSGEVDIQSGDVAKVWYINSDGNQVREILYSDGLDVRIGVTRDVVEGVTVPDTTVRVTVGDGSGEKGTAVVTADRTGHYRTQIPGDTTPIDIVSGDTVTVTALGTALIETVEVDVDVSHTSQIRPADDTVSGQLLGGVFPALGRVSLWHAETDEWYQEDMLTDAAGNYVVDFSGVVDVGSADRAIVWYFDPNGNQIGSVVSCLEIGTSITSDLIWGYTTPEVAVDITVRDSPGGSVIGTATTSADQSGFFETTVGDSPPLDILPGQEVNVVAGDLESSLLVSHLQVSPHFADQTLAINGPPSAILHVDLHRSAESTWIEVAADDGGFALVEVNGGYDLQGGDRLELVSYQVAQGYVIHQRFGLFHSVSLPLILRNS